MKRLNLGIMREIRRKGGLLFAVALLIMSSVGVVAQTTLYGVELSRDTTDTGGKFSYTHTAPATTLNILRADFGDTTGLNGKRLIFATNNLNIVVLTNVNATVKDSIYAGGALTITGGTRSSLRIDSTRTSVGTEKSHLNISGASVSIGGDVSVTVQTSKGDTALQARSGALSISTSGTVTALSDTAGFSIYAEGPITVANTSGLTAPHHVKSGGAITFNPGIVSAIDSVTANGAILVANANITHGNPQRDHGSDSAVWKAGGTITYTNVNPSAQKPRFHLLSGTSVTLNSGIEGDTVRASEPLIIASSGNRIHVIKGEKNITSNAGSSLRTDSIISTTGIITLNGSTNGRLSEKVGQIRAEAQDIIINGAVGDSISIYAKGDIAINTSVNALVRADSVGIRSVEKTVKINSGRTGTPGDIEAAKEILIAQGAYVSADTIRSTGEKIELFGVADTVAALITSNKPITIKGNVNANKPARAIIKPGTSTVEIGQAEGDPITVNAGIVNAGSVTIKNTNYLGADSLYASNSLTIAEDVKSVTVERNGIKSNTVTISGGNISVTNGIKSVASGPITIESPAVLSAVDSIVSAGGNILLSNITRSNAVGVITSTGGRITLNEGTTITVSDSIATDNTLEILGSLTVGGQPTDGQGAVAGAKAELITGGLLEVPGSLKLLAGDTVDIIANSISLTGSVSGQAGLVHARNTALEIQTSLRADSIKAKNSIHIYGEDVKVSLDSTSTKYGLRAAVVISTPQLYIYNGASVTTKNDGGRFDLDSATVVNIDHYGKLTRANGSAVVDSAYSTLYADGSATIRFANDYPRILSVATVYNGPELTVTVTADSVTIPAAGTFELYFNQIDPVNGNYAHETRSLTKDIPAVVTRAGEHTYITWTGPSTALGSDGFVSVVTKRGVAIAQAQDLVRATLARTLQGGEPGELARPAPSSVKEWSEPSNASNYIYTDETLTVTFTFARAAERDEELVFDGLATSSTKEGSTPYLKANTNILPAGSREVEVEFTAKSISIIPKTKPEGVPGVISASIKSEDGADVSSYGVPTTSSLRLFNVAQAKASFTPSSPGYSAKVELRPDGGSEYLRYRIRGNGDTWKLVSDQSFTEKELSDVFKVGSVIELKDANTGDQILEIFGPNQEAGSNPSTPPVTTQQVILVANEALITEPGLHTAKNQSFTFDVLVPTGFKVDLKIEEINRKNDQEWEVIGTSSATFDWVDNVDVLGSKRVLVSGITTSVRITVSVEIDLGVGAVETSSVWSSGNQLTIVSPVIGVAKIFSLGGTLVSEFTYNEGSTSIALPVGIYVVKLSTGVTYKVVIQ
jgi:hypothetical protein